MSVPYSVHMVDWAELLAKLPVGDVDAFHEWLAGQNCEPDSGFEPNASHFQTFADHYDECQQRQRDPWMNEFDHAIDIVCACERDSGNPTNEIDCDECSEFLQYAWSPSTVSQLSKEWNSARLEELLPGMKSPASSFFAAFYSSWKTMLDEATAKHRGLVVCVWS